MADTDTPQATNTSDDNTPPGGNATAPGYGDQGAMGAGADEIEQGAGTEGGTREGETQPDATSDE